MKYCLKCHQEINEDKDKFVMIITKLKGKILEFVCFHFDCWKGFLRENLEMLESKGKVKFNK